MLVLIMSCRASLLLSRWDGRADSSLERFRQTVHTRLIMVRAAAAQTSPVVLWTNFDFHSLAPLDLQYIFRAPVRYSIDVAHSISAAEGRGHLPQPVKALDGPDPSVSRTRIHC